MNVRVLGMIGVMLVMFFGIGSARAGTESAEESGDPWCTATITAVQVVTSLDGSQAFAIVEKRVIGAPCRIIMEAADTERERIEQRGPLLVPIPDP